MSLLSFKCRSSALKRALDNGLRVHSVNRHGNTLLHQAVIDDEEESVILLLNYGADRTLRNLLGYTSVQLAQFLNRKGIQRHFKSLSENKILFCDSPKEVLECSPQEFCDITGVEYITSPIFSSYRLLAQITREVNQRESESPLGIERRWLGAFYKTQIESHATGKVRVQRVDPQIGLGLFAHQAIKTKEFIGEYSGEVMRYLFFRGRWNDFVGEYALGGKDPTRFVIDAKEKGNHTRFINHSDQPNASAITVILEKLMRVIIIAERPIQPGEEITINYGPFYWRNRKNQKSDCAK